MLLRCTVVADINKNATNFIQSFVHMSCVQSPFLPLSHKRLIGHCCHPAGQATWTRKFVNMINQEEDDVGFSN